MISYLLRTIKVGAQSLRQHPQLFFVLMLLIVIPLLFLYSGQQFLSAGRDNQDRLQKDKVGILHDVFVSFMHATDFDVVIMQEEIDRIARLSNNINDFRVVTVEQGVVSPVAALNRELVGTIEPFVDMFINATVRRDESLIFEVPTTAGRVWFAYRAVIHPEDGRTFVIHTGTSLEAVDRLFLQRERQALFSLLFIFMFIVGLAYWHIRMTDYSYLYHKEQAENEIKDTFINMVAHELRAPLTAIRGYAELLGDRVVNADEKQFAVRIDKSTERLLALINDLLDVARLQEGKIEVTLGLIDVAPVVSGVISELSVTAAEKNITLVAHGADSPRPAVCDEVRLRQVLTNIINNSIKYTDQGTIEVEIVSKYRSLEVRVKDTGVGITAEDQQKLFAPFFRARTNDIEAITGSGLGMWISKRLILMMHGTIAVESIHGVGTHIVITLGTEMPSGAVGQAAVTPQRKLAGDA